jgi:amidohydrolase
MKEIFNMLEAHYPEMVELRRDFHMHPEISFKETRTAKIIADYLIDLGLDVKKGVGGNGVVGTLQGGHVGKTIALRADFDALAIDDEKEVPYKSKVPGVMHACGHDIHTASLLVVAKILSKHREKLHGNVVFIFQHAEEVAPGGAKPMVADGCLDGVDVIYGAHVEVNYANGHVAVCKGFVNAAADSFEIKIFGHGGHGALPHVTMDSTLIGSQLVVDLQQIVSRYVDPLKPALLTVGSIHSGSAPNIISDKAKIEGTIRTYDEDVRSEMEKLLKRFCAAASLKTGAKIEVNFQKGFPALYNHESETDRITHLAGEMFGSENVEPKEPEMGAEDFAYFLQEVPGTYFWVGGRNEEINAIYDHHHPKFDVDERSMLNIGKMFIATIFDEQRRL